MSKKKKSTPKAVPGWRITSYSPSSYSGVTGVSFIEYLIKGSDLVKLCVRFTEKLPVGSYQRRVFTTGEILYVHHTWSRGARSYGFRSQNPDGSLDTGYLTKYILGGYEKFGSVYELIVVQRGKRFYLEVPCRLVQCFELIFSTPHGLHKFKNCHHGEPQRIFRKDVFYGTIQPEKVSGYSYKYSLGGCSITTAVVVCLNNGQTGSRILAGLKDFRRNWLDTFPLGRKLSTWYDAWSPVVANWLEAQPGVCRFLYCFFIYPCARVLQQSENSQPLIKQMARVSVTVWYVVGSFTVQALYWLNCLLWR